MHDVPIAKSALALGVLAVFETTEREGLRGETIEREGLRGNAVGVAVGAALRGLLAATDDGVRARLQPLRRH